jgi:hypothetical protein
LRIAIGTLTGAGEDTAVGLEVAICDGLANAVGDALAVAVSEEAGVDEALGPTVDVDVTVGVGCAREATAEAIVDGRGVI